MAGKNFFSAKAHMYLLCEHSSPPVLPFVWQSQLIPNLSLTSFWQNIRDDLTEDYKNDLAWLISLRAVKLREKLKSWGYVTIDRCSSPRRETIDHCFLNCPRIKGVWSFFTPLFSRFIKSPLIANVLHVLFLLLRIC